MNFTIEQIALFPFPGKGEQALALLTALGFNRNTPWVHDTVQAHGEVFDAEASSTGHLSFAYQALKAPLEVEVLSYEANSPNWMDRVGGPAVSHLGMHCTAAELDDWHARLTGLGISVAQTVMTSAHSNPVIKDSRRYHYVIYDTRQIIGVDLKFIVRLNLDWTPYTPPELIGAAVGGKVY